MAIRINYLGHASFILTVNKKNILTDPYFHSKKVGKYNRLVDCSTKVTDLPKIDVVLISHEHFDNFDLDSVNYLVKKFNPKIVAHQSVLNKISNCDNQNKIDLNEFQTKTVNDISFTAYPAHHPASFYPLSYIISNNKDSIYFAGDTNMTKEHGDIKPDIAFLPIGGGESTMDVGSAIRVAKQMKPKLLIPMKFNTFKEIEQNPLVLKDKLDSARTPIKTVILEPGKSYNYK
ncbi:MAG: MBL fold metallo-hydrolase [archaeon]